MAHHLFQAGSAAELTKTLHYLEAAADAALVSGAPEEALAEELPHRVEQAEVSRWYARMLGDREKGRELLGEALSIYRELGMPKHGEMVEAMR